jgi:hypothetical protein
MKKKVTRPVNFAETKAPLFRVRLPGFINEEIGLGDVVKRITSAAGIKPCNGCQRRAAILTRWLVLSGGRKQS